MMDGWRHMCGGDAEYAEEKTASHRANDNNKRSLWTICRPWSKIAVHRDAAPGGKDSLDCRGEEAPRDRDCNVQMLRRGIRRRASSSTLNHVLEAAKPRPLFDRRSTLPIQLFVCFRSDVGAIADIVLRL
jgi:hypothetical protein